MMPQNVSTIPFYEIAVSIIKSSLPRFTYFYVYAVVVVEIQYSMLFQNLLERSIK